MLKARQYQIVKGSPAALSWTHNGVFRRGSTLRWRSHTLDMGIGAPYVWLTAQCPSSGRLFVQPPRYPEPEVRETIRGAISRSLERPHIVFVWPEEED
jgi:hypothetical protein